MPKPKPEIYEHMREGGVESKKTKIENARDGSIAMLQGFFRALLEEVRKGEITPEAADDTAKMINDKITGFLITLPTLPKQEKGIKL